QRLVGDPVGLRQEPATGLTAAQPQDRVQEQHERGHGDGGGGVEDLLHGSQTTRGRGSGAPPRGPQLRKTRTGPTTESPTTSPPSGTSWPTRRARGPRTGTPLRSSRSATESWPKKVTAVTRASVDP